MKKLLVTAAAAAMALTGAVGVAQADSHVKVGVLTCEVEPGFGYIIGSSKDLTCWFKPSGGGAGGRSGGQAALALGALAGQLAGAAHGLGLLARLLLGRLLVVVPQLHFAEDAFALQLLLQRAQRLVNIVIANNYLQADPPFVNRHQWLKSRARQRLSRRPTEPVTVDGVYS